MKQKGMSFEQVVNVADIAANKLPYMESFLKHVKEEVDKMELTRQRVLQHIESLNHKVLILDKAGLSIK